MTSQFIHLRDENGEIHETTWLGDVISTHKNHDTGLQLIIGTASTWVGVEITQDNSLSFDGAVWVRWSGVFQADCDVNLSRLIQRSFDKFAGLL